MQPKVGDVFASLGSPILITGHTGFKGTWLTLLLERFGLEVVGYSKPAKSGTLYERLDRSKRVREYLGDVRDKEQFHKFLHSTKSEVIFHLAAQPLVIESYKNPLETLDVNVIGTASVLDAAINSGFVKLVVVVTSDKVYANNNSKTRFNEENVLWGYDPYSSSKVGAELVADAWRNVSANRGSELRILTVRSGNVIGGGDNSPGRLMTDVVEGFLAKSSVKVKHPESTRPWQYVLDPLIGYLMAAEHKLVADGPETFNFGPTTNSLSVKQVLEVAQNYWPELTKAEFAKDSHPLEKKYLDLDSNLAQSVLKWKPKWTQENAVRSTLKWWRSVQFEQIKPIQACNSDLDFLL